MEADNKKNENNSDLGFDICPLHNVKGDFIPPPVPDEKRKKLIFTFKCPHGHNFTKEC
jgi:hypothetical protein